MAQESTSTTADVVASAAIAETGPNYRRYVLFLLVLAYTSSHVDRNILGILIQPIKAELMLTDTQLGFLSGIAFSFFYATLGIPIALLADRSNRRNIIAAAIAIWSGMTAVCGLAHNFWHLALARIGVGIGEAGSSPPSLSIITDLYPREQRSAAMAIYSLGTYFGAMLGLVIGGWVAHYYGWRMVFFIVGLPGLIIALLVRYTIAEPKRTMPIPAAGGLPGKSRVLDGFKHLWRMKTTRHLLVGGSLSAMFGYGSTIWAAAFLSRSHGFTSAEIGTIIGPILGICGGLGSLSGGYLADYLAARDIRWNAWMVGIAKALAIPFFLCFYLVGNSTLAILCFIPATFFSAFSQGPVFAMIQSLSPGSMRALNAAIMLFIFNLIGLGLGPQMIGIASDLLSGYAGEQSLRYALVLACGVGIWASAHYYIAGGKLPVDTATAAKNGYG
ncbi:MAG: MFS transporter [Parvibaculum sp.]|uniref:spinster family MFS transporter n=1 Tax=Parvibaculum sp. TaxID=2024848 RepID=UPI003C7141DB